MEGQVRGISTYSDHAEKRVKLVHCIKHEAAHISYAFRIRRKSNIYYFFLAILRSIIINPRLLEPELTT